MISNEIKNYINNYDGKLNFEINDEEDIIFCKGIKIRMDLENKGTAAIIFFGKIIQFPIAFNKEGFYPIDISCEDIPIEDIFKNADNNINNYYEILKFLSIKNISFNFKF